jgi:CheY-like chemotaxis protein
MVGEEQAAALGIARDRFLEGLPRKAAEVMGAVEALAAQPSTDRVREDLRRRLHALYAATQVFRTEALTESVKVALDLVDALKRDRRAPNEGELTALREVARRLPDLGRGGADAGPKVVTVRGASAAPVDGVLPVMRKPTTLPVADERLGSPTEVLSEAQSSQRRPASATSETPRHATLRGIPSVQPTADAAAAAHVIGRLDSLMASDRRVRRNTDPLATTDVPASSMPIPYNLSEPSRPEGARPYYSDPIVEERARQLTTPAPPPGELARQSMRSDLPPPQMAERTVCAVLLLDDRGELASIPIVLPTREFEVTSAASENAGLRLARTGAPDVILAEASFLRERAPTFVRALRADPRIPFVPVVCVVGSGEQLSPSTIEQLGADASIERPIDADELQRLLTRVTGLATEPGLPLPQFGDVTAAEVADKVAQEIRRGLVETAQLGQGHRFDVGDGSTVMAAAWGAIARIRADLYQRSDGKVQFRGEMGRGGPRFVSVGEQASTQEERFDFVTLVGRTIIVADDQAEVRDLFGAALESSGAQVVMAADGAEALREAERARPDAIVSDVLMPNLNGFGLCRAIEAHPELDDVPVILISWKTDLLDRMRDMGSGASGYLTKDADSQSIVRAVKSALWPRERLVAELKLGSEVRGRVEDVGLRLLLKAVARRRSRAKVDIRDPKHTFSLEFRGGRLLSASATTLSGEAVHGEDAVALLLDIGSARYTVTARDEREGRLSDAVRSAVTADDPVVQKFIRSVELVEEPTDTEYDGPEPLRTLKPGVLGPSQSGVMRSKEETPSTSIVGAPEVQPSFFDNLSWLWLAAPLCFCLAYATVVFFQGVTSSRIDPSTGAPLTSRRLSTRGWNPPRKAIGRQAIGRQTAGRSVAFVRSDAQRVAPVAPTIALPAGSTEAPPTKANFSDAVAGTMVASVPTGVALGERDGVVEIAISGAPWESVFAGDRPLGALPARAVLPEGRHTFTFTRGDEVRYRVWYVRRGHTRSVSAP